MWSKNWKIWVHPRFLVGLMLLDNYFSVLCFVDYCFFCCPLYSLYFDLLLLITSLVYSNYRPPTCTDTRHYQEKKYQKVKGRKHAHRLYYGHFCKFYSSEMIFTSISSKHVRSIELPMFHAYKSKVIFTRLGHRASA
jgi:hypothetical protein